MENKIAQQQKIESICGVECYEQNGTAYLKLETVARGLGFTQEKNGVEYVKWERVNGYLNEIGFSPKVGKLSKDAYIPENVFYRLAMKAKNETAEKFQALVADEIIPSIRKHGVYATKEFILKALQDPDTAIRLLTELKDERAKRKSLEVENQEQAKIIADFQPKARYIDEILSSQDAITVSQIAADYGLTAQELNLILYKQGVQRNVNGQWILTRNFLGKGYTDSETGITITENGEYVHTKMFTKWTQKGRMFIHKILEIRGIMPVRDLEK